MEEPISLRRQRSRWAMSTEPSYRSPIENVGLVTGQATGRARQAARTTVVYPVPSSPLTNTTSRGRSVLASSAPRRSVSAEEAELLFIRGGLGYVLGDQLGQPVDVGSEQIEDRRRAQRRGRVEQRIERDHPASQLAPLRLAMDLRNAALAAGEQLRRVVAEGADHLRLDQLDPPYQERGALLDLLRERVAVPGRPAHEAVVDEHVLTVEPDLSEELVEELPRRAHEGEALEVLLGARRLADEHDVGVRVPRSEHEPGASGFERAFVLTRPVVELHQLRAPL